MKDKYSERNLLYITTIILIVALVLSIIGNTIQAKEIINTRAAYHEYTTKLVLEKGKLNTEVEMLNKEIVSLKLEAEQYQEACERYQSIVEEYQTMVSDTIEIIQNNF